MRKVGLALVATTAVLSLTASVAEAGVTCKLIPSWCVSAEHFERKEDGKKTAVPEPASLLLLGIGASAVGAAMARRRRNHKDK